MMDMKKFVGLLLLCAGLSAQAQKKPVKPLYVDKAFTQDYSVKYYVKDPQISLKSAFSDRNEAIKIFGSDGLMIPHDGQFLYPGSLGKDQRNRTSSLKKIQSLLLHENQFVFMDDVAIFSHAWAGTLYSKHQLPKANIFAGGNDFAFLISDGSELHLVKHSKTIFKLNVTGDKVLAIEFDKTTGYFWVLTSKGLSRFDPASGQLSLWISKLNLTAFDVEANEAILGSTEGYFKVNLKTQNVGKVEQKIPVKSITSVKIIGEKIWFGSTNGAFALRKDGKFDYYQGERWLPGNMVTSISEGPNKSILILTSNGLGQICFKSMTLHEKAMFYEKQVRDRHIRHGFNAQLKKMDHGNISTGYLSDSDNDGLWTSMYLGGEIFRYAVTKEAEALANIREAFESMERLYTVNPVPGFPARSYERSGFISQLSDPERWQHAPEPEWDWKSTTSSDEVIGHIFAFGALAELVDVPDLQKRSIVLIDTLMSHIIKNNMYLIDYDGKPTLWGKWNPDYVNGFSIHVGDRKLNSSNIVAMLQTAYRFTKKPIYKQKAFELMQKFGYYENLMRPIGQIGHAPEDADPHAKNLSDGWNHSDDEMYFVGYWGLYRYAFNDTLRSSFKKSILDHWQSERPEKEGAWNIFTALTGAKEFDLDEAAWYLREHPLDLIDWAIQNSHRGDIEMLAPNFRKQTTKEVLPPDERPIQRHNSNMFTLDYTRGNGDGEHSAGDIWLLPYWMGRYLKVISAPEKGK
jgi:hypothetical protein